MARSTKTRILRAVDDAVRALLDECSGDLEQAVCDGDLTLDEIADRFRDTLAQGIEGVLEDEEDAAYVEEDDEEEAWGEEEEEDED